jgi:hypothetical protein
MNFSLRSIFLSFLIFMLHSCISNNTLTRIDDRYLNYNVLETSHFILISKKLERSKLEGLLDILENVYYSITYELGSNYNFKGPYKIFIYSDDKEKFNDIADEKDLEIVFSTDTRCQVVGQVVYLILKDVLQDYLDFYPVIRFGYPVYYERKYCADKESYYFKLFSDFVKGGYNPFYLFEVANPQNLTEAEISKYYSVSSQIIKFLIEEYGLFKFSIFIDKLRKGLSFNESLKDVYFLYPAEIKKKLFEKVR